MLTQLYKTLSPLLLTLRPNVGGGCGGFAVPIKASGYRHSNILPFLGHVLATAPHRRALRGVAVIVYPRLACAPITRVKARGGGAANAVTSKHSLPELHTLEDQLDFCSQHSLDLCKDTEHNIM